MKRRLLNHVTIVSLLLCVAACVLWASSYFTAISLYRQDAGVNRSLISDSGMLVFTEQNAPDGATFSWRRIHNRPGGWGGAHLRPDWYGRFQFGSRHAWVPWWWACAALALLPACRMVCRAAVAADRFPGERRRVREGLCRACGYDLRATPDKCPECGAAAGLAGG
jgi:hypothetical protein